MDFQNCLLSSDLGRSIKKQRSQWQIRISHGGNDVIRFKEVTFKTCSERSFSQYEKLPSSGRAISMIATISQLSYGESLILFIVRER